MIHCTKVTYILEQLNDDVGLKRALQEYACVYRTHSYHEFVDFCYNDHHPLQLAT